MRNIKMNQMYRHFKGANYFTLAVSEPVSTINIIGKLRFVKVRDTETDKEFDVLINPINGKAIHNESINDKKLIIYRDAYKNTDIIWAREYEMFAERLHIDQYPDHEDEYRFEEVEL